MFLFRHWPGPVQHMELVGDLLKELSSHSERVEERRAALLELLKVTRDDSVAVWEEHFKTMLLLLLETLGDKDVSDLLHSSMCLSGYSTHREAECKERCQTHSTILHMYSILVPRILMSEYIHELSVRYIPKEQYSFYSQ